METRKTWKRQAIGVSLCVHIAALIALFFWQPWRDWNDSTISGSADPEVADRGAADGSSGQPDPHQTLTERTPVASVTSDKVRDELHQMVQESQELTDDQNLERLQGMVQRFDDIGSHRTVDELSRKFEQWWGTRSAPTSQESDTAKPDSGSTQAEFDSETALIQDVRRQRDAQGDWIYEAVLVDSRGKSQVVPLEVAEGQRLHQTLKIVKSSPLVQRIYREITMPIMRRMLQQQQDAEPAEVDAPDE